MSGKRGQIKICETRKLDRLKTGGTQAEMGERLFKVAKISLIK